MRRGAGVPAADIQRRPEPTRDVYVTRKTGGEREFVGFSAEADQYADCHIDIASLPVEKIKAASVVVSGTLGLAFDGTGSAIRKAVSIARSAGICVFIDVNWRPVFFKDPTVVKDDITAFVRQADIVKLTDDEAQWMFDIPADVARQAPNEVLAQLPTARGVLVTAGEKGATYCFRTQYGLHSGFFPAFAVDVVDTTGAGDAFTSGFLYQMLKYGGIDGFLASPDAVDDAVEFASASGGVTASGAGAMEAQPKSPSEVMQLIEVYKCP